MNLLNIVFKEKKGCERTQIPVSFGIPIAKGLLKDEGSIMLNTEWGSLPYAGQTLSRWSDQSIRWFLIDTQIDLSSNSNLQIKIDKICDRESKKNKTFKNIGSFQFSKRDNEIQSRFNKNSIFKLPFLGTEIENERFNFQSIIQLTVSDEKVILPKIESWEIEYSNHFRDTLLIKGMFGENTKKTLGIRFNCRIHRFKDKKYHKAEFTLLNTRPAVHPRGAWDLGDDNSFFFKDLSIKFVKVKGEIYYAENIIENSGLTKADSDIQIYQGSSGLPNWKSKTHINKDSEIPIKINGYTVKCDEKYSIKEKSRAFPIIYHHLEGEKEGFFCFSDNFWQNFPKTISSKNREVTLGLFPKEFGDLFELQPGEQKTHTFYYGFEDAQKVVALAQSLAYPLIPEYDCAEISKTLTRPRPLPLNKINHEKKVIRKYDNYVKNVVEGSNSFKSKNLIVDEFGWRNFGDVFADHESVLNKDADGFVSHYNNQYDVIKGLLFQYLRTSDIRYYNLSVEMADHVCDVDIYHTDGDKYQYNHGLFWHTDHHLDAYTSTHRTISKRHSEFKPDWAFGGGPFPEHNYATGLIYLYWLTGNERYKEAALELCLFITNWLEGPDTYLDSLLNTAKNIIKSLKLNFNSKTDEVYLFNGPCRASGNSLNTLLDGFLLTEDKIYLMHAENLILQAVHPDDDQNSMNLLNAEIRWFYTVFLQALCRYLDVKKSMDQLDDYFEYARQVLVNYALWMAENEYPYLEKPEILEFPNETWAAQDVRKADIFAIASEYVSGDFIDLLKERSHFFFKHAIEELGSFETRFYTRPMVLLLTNGMPYFEMLYKDSKAMTEPKYNPNFSLNPTSKNVLPKRHRIKIEKKLSLRREAKWLKMQIKSRI